MSSCKVIALRTRKSWDENQELVGQGLAKVAAAFCQSMPVSGSFSRSALNLASNATTGLSGLVCAAFVLATLLFLTPFLYHLPKPVLAAMIILAVLNLVDLPGMLHAWQASRDDGFAGTATFVVTLAFAPNIQNRHSRRDHPLARRVPLSPDAPARRRRRHACRRDAARRRPFRRFLRCIGRSARCASMLRSISPTRRFSRTPFCSSSASAPKPRTSSSPRTASMTSTPPASRPSHARRAAAPERRHAGPGRREETGAGRHRANRPHRRSARGKRLQLGESRDRARCSRGSTARKTLIRAAFAARQCAPPEPGIECA